MPKSKPSTLTYEDLKREMRWVIVLLWGWLGLLGSLSDADARSKRVKTTIVLFPLIWSEALQAEGKLDRDALQDEVSQAITQSSRYRLASEEALPAFVSALREEEEFRSYLSKRLATHTRPASGSAVHPATLAYLWLRLSSIPASGSFLLQAVFWSPSCRCFTTFRNLRQGPPRILSALLTDLWREIDPPSALLSLASSDEVAAKAFIQGHWQDKAPEIRQRCSRNDGLACLLCGLLATYDPSRFSSALPAVFFFRRACLFNEGLGCSNLGFLHATGQGTPQAIPLARELYKKACALSDGVGCRLLGLLHTTGQIPPPTPATPRELYKKACDLSDGSGCNALGAIYYAGQSVEQDDQAAQRFFRRSCDLGWGVGCNNLASLLAKRGGDKESKARKLYQKACDLRFAPGCRNLAQALEEGSEASRDLAQAAVFYQRACELHDRVSCRDLALKLASSRFGRRDLAQARTFHKRACDLQSIESCRDLAILYTKGRGGLVDLAAGRAFFRRACASKDALSCRSLGILYENGKGESPGKDCESANRWYQRACRLGLQAACTEICR